MANVIAVIWDCDKTLIDGYMQAPMFKEWGVDEAEFWKENNQLPQKYLEEQGVKVNPETIYLNNFIRKVKSGEFCPISNETLKAFGQKLTFYSGIPKFLGTLKDCLKNSENASLYKEYNITVENYIISTGFKQVIVGSNLNQYVDDIWGCELIESENENGEKVISEIGYTIDNTTKTRALFEINKGVNKLQQVNVNDKIPDDLRRVPFDQMIYVADGPSDIPAFSVVNKGGGYTMAVYPHGDGAALQQVEQLRATDRVKMYAEANFDENSMAYMLIIMKVKEIADSIVKREREKLQSAYTSAPKHLV